MTAYGTVKTAVKAMKLGAEDYLGKPIDVEELEVVLQRVLEKKRLLEETRVLRERVDQKYRFDNLVGESPEMLAAFKTVQQVAPSSRPRCCSSARAAPARSCSPRPSTRTARAGTSPSSRWTARRCRRRCWRASCSATRRAPSPGALYTRAGRFEMADGGTLFLDEIGDISPTVQVKLLRFLEEREFERVGGNQTFKVDVRIVAATHRDLDEEARRRGPSARTSTTG